MPAAQTSVCDEIIVSDFIEVVFVDLLIVTFPPSKSETTVSSNIFTPFFSNLL